MWSLPSLPLTTLQLPINFLIYFPNFSSFQQCFLCTSTQSKVTHLCSHIYLILYIEPLSLNLVSYLCANSFHLQVAQSQHNPKHAYLLPSNSCPTCTYSSCHIFLTAVSSCWPGLSSFRCTLQFSDCLEYYPPHRLINIETLSTFSLLICITVLPRNQSLTHLTVTRIKKLSLITQGWQENTKALQTNHEDSTADYYGQRS